MYTPEIIHLLRECDTSEVAHARIRIVPARKRPKANATTPGQLHDVLAQECPGLCNLQVKLLSQVSNRYTSSSFSFNLFSRPSIRTLSIDLSTAGVDAEGRMGEVGQIDDQQFLARFLQNLSALCVLKLGCSKSRLYNADLVDADHWICPLVVIEVSSKSLQKLQVQDFCTTEVWFSVDCPKLQTVQCAGVCYNHINGHDMVGVCQQVVNADEHSLNFAKCLVEFGGDPTLAEKGIFDRFLPMQAMMDLDPFDSSVCLRYWLGIPEGAAEYAAHQAAERESISQMVRNIRVVTSSSEN